MAVDKELSKRVINRRKEIIRLENNNRDKFNYRKSGKYVEIKLKHVRKYLYIYSKIVGSKFREMWYIEPESGPGCCEITNSGRILLGSPLLALTNEPFFNHYRFIDKDKKCAECLNERIKEYFPDKDAIAKQGDCNLILNEILDEIPDKTPFLTFIDPKGLEFKMSTLELISKKEKAEFYINYPYHMAVQRCISPNMYEATQKTVTEYFGGEEWISIRDKLYKNSISSNEAEKKFLDLYMSKIKELGFLNVQYSDVIRNDTNHPLYYLIHASNVQVAKRTMKDVMKKNKTNQNQQTLF